MSVQLSLHQKLPPAVGHATQIKADLFGYYPPHGYYFQYQFELQTPSQMGKSRIVQNYSIDNILLFTSLENGMHKISVSAKMFSQLMDIPVDNIFTMFCSEMEIEFIDPSVMQAPCCVPLSKCIAPLYHTPLMKAGQQIRIVMMPQIEKTKTQFSPPQTIPQVIEVDFNVKNSALGKMQPPMKSVYFSAWNDTRDSEMYILNVGMVSGFIYSIKHQIQEGDKKFELKNNIQYQVENNPPQKLLFQPVFMSEYKDRQFLILSDNYVYNLNNLQKHLLVHNKSSDSSESLLLTSYGQPLVNLNCKIDLKNPFHASAIAETQKLRILDTNSSYLLCLGGGVNTFLFQGYNMHTLSANKTLATSLALQMDQNFHTSNCFPDQKIVISTPSGVPLRTIDIASINTFFYTEFQQKLKEFQPQFDALEAFKREISDENDENLKVMEGKCPKRPVFRQLVRFNYFKILEDGTYIVSAQAEEKLSQYQFLETNVSSAVKASGKKFYFDPTEISMLSAVILHIKHTGEVINKIFISDVFPETLTQIHFTRLLQPTDEKLQYVQKPEIPGLFSSTALIHSQVNSFDCTKIDIIIPLSLQNAILRINMSKFDAVEEVKDVFNEIILYSQTKTDSILSHVFKELLGNITPLSINRVSDRMYLLYNSVNGTEVSVIKLPEYISFGPSDMTDLLQNEDFSSQEQVPVNLRTVPEIHETILLSKEQSEQGNVCGLLKGGLVASWKLQNHWRIAEIKTGSCVYAAVCHCENITILRSD